MNVNVIIEILYPIKYELIHLHSWDDAIEKLYRTWDVFNTVTGLLRVNYDRNIDEPTQKPANSSYNDQHRK